MLTHNELVGLYRRLHDQQVLSIYLDGVAHDPAERTAWRRRLDQRIGELERTLEDSPTDRKGFRDSLALLAGDLEGFDSFLPGRGWVGFATPTEVVYSETVAVPMPDLVRWEKGIRVAPYVRALKQERSVFVALADQRQATVFEYAGGRVREVSSMSADTEVGDLTDVGVAKRGGTYSGVRGQTGTDAARRFLDQGVERMLKGLMDELIVRVDGSGLLVVGGTPETVAAIMSQAPGWLAKRTLAQPSLHIGMSTAEVQMAAEDSASILTGHLQQKLLDQVIDLARSRARGCLGPESTEAALLGGRVDALLLSRRYIREHSDRADWCVGSAFSQGADVEEVSLDVADQLDREGGGIGARLRFVVAAAPGSALAGP